MLGFICRYDRPRSSIRTAIVNGSRRARSLSRAQALKYAEALRQVFRNLVYLFMLRLEHIDKHRFVISFRICLCLSMIRKKNSTIEFLSITSFL